MCVPVQVLCQLGDNGAHSINPYPCFTAIPVLSCISSTNSFVNLPFRNEYVRHTVQRQNSSSSCSINHISLSSDPSPGQARRVEQHTQMWFCTFVLSPENLALRIVQGEWPGY